MILGPCPLRVGDGFTSHTYDNGRVAGKKGMVYENGVGEGGFYF